MAKNTGPLVASRVAGAALVGTGGAGRDFGNLTSDPA